MSDTKWGIESAVSANHYRQVSSQLLKLWNRNSETGRLGGKRKVIAVAALRNELTDDGRWGAEGFLRLGGTEEIYDFTFFLSASKVASMLAVG